jgi:Ca2+-transporting ATPase
MTYGRNQLEVQKTRSRWLIFLQQFLDPMVYILLFATGLAMIFQEWIEAMAILVVIMISTAIGYFMESQAIKSMDALRRLALTKSRVIRDGTEQIIASEEIVPGDIVHLKEGDVVPADGRIIDHRNLGVKEDALTGESGQVEKTSEIIPINTALPDQTNMVFSGTIISRGDARVVITGTGRNTELGKIEKMSREADSEGTPLDKKLMRLNRMLIWVCGILVLIVTGVGLWRGRDLWLTIETSIALAVAAIPEGLPIVATIALARGILKLAKKNVIIKKMEAVQTLGEMGIIFTDKTGTLTENKMAAHSIHLRDLQINHWPPKDPTLIENHSDLKSLVHVAILCNNSDFAQERGDPLEIALYEFARDLGCDIEAIKKEFSKIKEIPFDSTTRSMTSIYQKETKYFTFSKGASENLLARCQFKTGEHSADFWNQSSNKLASDGLRVLAFAQSITDHPPDNENGSMDFLGIIGFLDTPRSDVRQVINTYHAAGIKVIMLTGDHPNTAKKIAEDVGISDDNSTIMVIKGADLPDLTSTDQETTSKILNTSVFARVLPAQKLDIVRFFQKNKFIVGMTGDGVNDAPALKKADVGIAMGIRGTEAAKEVADIILKDDRFGSIHSAIYQGRTIFENIRNFVIYLMSSNFAEIAVVAVASFLSLPQPLLPLQILFLNLVTDVFPALALSTIDSDPSIMRKPPRPVDEPIMTPYHWGVTAIYGFSIALAVTGITLYSYIGLQLDHQVINNMAFYTLVLSQLLNIFNVPSAGTSPIVNEITKNVWVWLSLILSLFTILLAKLFPITSHILSLVFLSGDQYLLVVLFSFASLFFSQLLKNTFKL